MEVLHNLATAHRIYRISSIHNTYTWIVNGGAAFGRSVSVENQLKGQKWVELTVCLGNVQLYLVMLPCSCVGEPVSEPADREQTQKKVTHCASLSFIIWHYDLLPFSFAIKWICIMSDLQQLVCLSNVHLQFMSESLLIQRSFLSCVMAGNVQDCLRKNIFKRIPQAYE